MKKLGAMLGLAVIGAIIGAGAMVYAQDTPAAEGPVGEKGIIVGDVISVADFAMFGRRGDEHVASGKMDAENGLPLAIIEDETEEVWLAVFRDPAPASHMESANKYLGEYMGKKVTVQGLKYRAKGVNLIRMSVISEY